MEYHSQELSDRGRSNRICRVTTIGQPWQPHRAPHPRASSVRSELAAKNDGWILPSHPGVVPGLRAPAAVSVLVEFTVRALASPYLWAFEAWGCWGRGDACHRALCGGILGWAFAGPPMSIGYTR